MDTISDPNVIAVDFGAEDRPKYVVLELAVRDAIARGALRPGTRLPPVRDLAWRVGVTPGTVARAYARLTDDGTCAASVGRGTYVAASAPSPDDKPLGLDAVPHGSEGSSYAVSLFSPHLPDVGQGALIRSVMAQVASDPPSGVMHYPGWENGRAAREAVLHWLDGAPLGRPSQEEVVLSHGGQSAIGIVLQTVLTGRRPTVLVEELAYPGFRRAAELLRAEVVPVAMDADGIVPDALAALARGGAAQVLCTSPEIHNPTVLHTPEARRREIAAVARRYDLQILEDDCYRLAPSRALHYRALAPERSWHVSSVAKSITPALRFGFAIAPEARAAQLRRTAEAGYFGLATPLTDMMAALLTHPDLPRIQAATRATVGRYVRAAARILDGHDLSFREDACFLWLGLPHGWRASAFCRAAEAEGVQIRAAEDYAPRDARTPHAVRLSVNAGVTQDSFEAAIGRLRALLDTPPERIEV